jgi:hypothetical protein
MRQERVPRISVFTDCGSKSVVMRIPYEFAAMMVASAPACSEKTELIKWLGRQSSPDLKEMMKKYNVYLTEWS